MKNEEETNAEAKTEAKLEAKTEKEDSGFWPSIFSFGKGSSAKGSDSDSSSWF